MEGRRKQPEQTRRAILDAADHEFSRLGYSGAGLGGIVSRAGLTKGALFHHFPDKRALAAAWISERLGGYIRETWVERLEGKDRLEALRDRCREEIQAVPEKSQLGVLAALAAELSLQDEPLRVAIEEVFSAWRGSVAGVLERGKQAGLVHRSVDPPAEAAWIVAALSGTAVTARATVDAAVRRGCHSAFEAYLETLRAVNVD